MLVLITLEGATYVESRGLKVAINKEVLEPTSHNAARHISRTSGCESMFRVGCGTQTGIPRKGPPAASPGTVGQASRCPCGHPRPRSPPKSASAVRSESWGLPKRPAQPSQVRRRRPFPLDAHLAAP